MLLLGGAAGCGGGGSNTVAEDPVVDSNEPAMDPDKAAALQRMRERQAIVCDDLCVRLNDCVRADAEENNPEVLGTKDGISGEQLLEKHKTECVDSCNNSGIMTPAQRKTLVEQCFPIEDCQGFAACSGDALSK
ncbi:MAG TPA: hypothetical protein VML75_09165 [Kofleriaceae bacterium]|nr:hypothetical protein [Kofleriaceae bacterium]